MVLSGPRGQRSGRSLGPCDLNNHSHQLPDSPWGRDTHGARQLLGWSWDQLCLLATAAGARRAWGAHWSLRAALGRTGAGGWAPAVPKGTDTCLANRSYWPRGQPALIDPGSAELQERMVLPKETAQVLDVPALRAQTNLKLSSSGYRVSGQLGHVDFSLSPRRSA